MIAVIADDLTGAAELAGLGIRYGMTVEVVCNRELKSAADLLVIATDTRSMPLQQALKEIAALTAQLDKTKPDIIFKKVDSVLRGHVIQELKIQLPLLGLKRALIVPANPALGRTTSDGKYFINGKPAHLSSFARDPEFAVTSPEIHSMLRVSKDEIRICKPGEQVPEQGITVGECSAERDINAWVKAAGAYTLLAGGSGLFKALLESVGLKPKSAQDMEPGLNYPALFVCGSTFSKSKAAIGKISREGGPVSYMPADIVNLAEPGEALFDAWAGEIVSLLKIHHKAIVAIYYDIGCNAAITAANLRNKKALVIEKVLEKTLIKELLIEGGSTAAAIINRLSFNRLSPVNEYSTGVIKLKVDGKDDLFLTLKPGSYDWPARLWRF